MVSQPVALLSILPEDTLIGETMFEGDMAMVTLTVSVEGITDEESIISLK